MYKKITDFIRKTYNNSEIIPLHVPRFIGNEKKYLNECIDSTFVSSAGNFVNRFEDMIKKFTGAKYAVATINGTSALHLALIVCGVKRNDEVLTQALTYVAAANAINYVGAECIFIDSDKETFGMCPCKLTEFLEKKTVLREDGCYNKKTGRKISACIPMHTYGHPVKISKIKKICDKYNIVIIEDSSQSLGSMFQGKHTGTFGKVGVYSFNGNKIITTGSGGMMVTSDKNLFKKCIHLSTTAKISHKWEHAHDEIGYNYRLSNINAALGCAQMDNIRKYIKDKRELAQKYKEFFKELGIEFFSEKKDCYSNYWLDAIIFKNKKERNGFLEYSRNSGVMASPLWTPMNKLHMYRNCETTNLENAAWLKDRVVSIPSSVRL